MLTLGQYPSYGVNSLSARDQRFHWQGRDRGESTSDKSLPYFSRTLKISSSPLLPTLSFQNPSLLHHKTELSPQKVGTKEISLMLTHAVAKFSLLTQLNSGLVLVRSKTAKVYGGGGRVNFTRLLLILLFSNHTIPLYQKCLLQILAAGLAISCTSSFNNLEWRLSGFHHAEQSKLCFLKIHFAASALFRSTACSAATMTD